MMPSRLQDAVDVITHPRHQHLNGVFTTPRSSLHVEMVDIKAGVRVSATHARFIHAHI
jgi:hypothetical protein